MTEACPSAIEALHIPFPFIETHQGTALTPRCRVACEERDHGSGGLSRRLESTGSMSAFTTEPDATLEAEFKRGITNKTEALGRTLSDAIHSHRQPRPVVRPTLHPVSRPVPQPRRSKITAAAGCFFSSIPAIFRSSARPS